MVSKTQDYEVPKELRKAFTVPETQELIKAFKYYDKNADGTMDASEFKQTLKDLGHGDLSEAEVKAMLDKVDRNNDNVIQWVEFLEMFKGLKGEGKSTEVFTSAGGKEGVKVGHRSYLLEEVHVFARLINRTLEGDEDVKDFIPMDPDSDDLFSVFNDGVVLCKLINCAVKDTIDMRVVNMGKNLNIYKVRENLNLAMAAAVGVGIKTIGIDASAFLNGTEHLILAVLWQLAREISTQSVSLQDCPEIMRLAEEGETLQQLNSIPVEQMLIRWMNFHLDKAGKDKIKNLGGDLKDAKSCMYVLNQLDPANCPLDGITEEDDVKRAEKMIANSRKMGMPDVIAPGDLCKGNPKVNIVFVAEMFNCKHGLEELTQEEYDAAALIDDDIEGSKEERQFRLWINSLGIEDVYINDLYEEIKDGLLLLKVIHKINPNVIDWKQVQMTPNNVFMKGINCGLGIDACKKMDVVLAGIGGTDIQDGNKKLVLAVVWQLVRIHYLQIIGSKSEQDLIKWANEQVEDPQIKDLKDNALNNGVFLIKLCAAIEPRAVNWDLVTKGETDEDKQLNAKYAISVARKLGAVIFLVWDDITVVNYKMMLIFVAELYDVKHGKNTDPAPELQE